MDREIDLGKAQGSYLWKVREEERGDSGGGEEREDR